MKKVLISIIALAAISSSAQAGCRDIGTSISECSSVKVQLIRVSKYHTDIMPNTSMRSIHKCRVSSESHIILPKNASTRDNLFKSLLFAKKNNLNVDMTFGPASSTDRTCTLIDILF